MLKIHPSWNQEYLKELSQEQLDFLEKLQNDGVKATIEEFAHGNKIHDTIDWAKLYNDPSLSREALDRFCVREHFGMQGTNIDPNDGYKFQKQLEKERRNTRYYCPEEHHDELMKHIAAAMINDHELEEPKIGYGYARYRLRINEGVYLFDDLKLKEKLLADAKLFAERWLDRNRKALVSASASIGGLIYITPSVLEHDLVYTEHIDLSPEPETEVQKHQRISAEELKPCDKLLKNLK